MYSDFSIEVESLSKCYHIYDKPRDRLRQMLAYSRKQFFREFWALRDVTFTIGRGETVGIIGRNGSGKSTLLQMICGTVSPTSGTVKTNGRVAALLELGAGFNAEFTGRENVFLNAAILGISKEEMQARMEEVLAFSELGEFLDRPVKTYSSGMHSRLAFSIAIHVNPEILIVDEALAVGDARFVAKCMRRIKDLQKGGATILFVSHDVGSVRTLCSRALWLDKGRMIEQGDVFPVTGRFMEFMFRDDMTEENIPQQSTTLDKNAHPLNQREASENLKESSLIAAAIDDRPVTHWGSNKGIILSAAVHDGQGLRIDLHQWGAVINIIIEVNVPLNISRKHLGVAFSIKDLKGTDLIVSTTQDFDRRQLPFKEHFSVQFSFINPLIAGKYLLVAAVENRHQGDVHYYEYVEGAHYFSCTSTGQLFGLFQPLIEQKLIGA